MIHPARIAFCAAGVFAAVSFQATTAYADHAQDCTAFAVEAKALQNASGLWLAERRFLDNRRGTLKPGTPAFAAFQDRNKLNGQKSIMLMDQYFDMSQRLFVLTRDAPCMERADIDAALVKANNFLTGPREPPPLPLGMCRISPDMSVAPAPCPPKP